MHQHFKHCSTRHNERYQRRHPVASQILLFLLVVSGLGLVTTAISSAQAPGPFGGSVGITGTMPTDAPTVAAVITSPTTGQRFTNVPIIVNGTCPSGTLVELLKNDIFAGSAPCDASGNFTAQIDLLYGENTLLARVYDVLNQAGPDSTTVTVYYDILPTQASPLTPFNFGGAQLLLQSNAVYRGIFPGQELSIPLEVLGGVPPYALNIQWGDGKNSIVARENTQPFSASHTYDQAGTYQITIQASDAQGRVAFLTIVSIVNGQPEAITQTNDEQSDVNKLLVLWPLYAAAFAVAISFWLGERREKHMLEKHGLLIDDQPEVSTKSNQTQPIDNEKPASEQTAPVENEQPTPQQ